MALQQQVDALDSQIEVALQPAGLDCYLNSSCPGTKGFIYQDGYLTALTIDTGPQAALLRAAQVYQLEDDLPPTIASAALDAFSTLLEPGTASVTVLGLLTYGISSLLLYGRNPAPKKRRYRSSI